jgi:hypothetical protein
MHRGVVGSRTSVPRRRGVIAAVAGSCAPVLTPRFAAVNRHKRQYEEWLARAIAVLLTMLYTAFDHLDGDWPQKDV